MMNLLPLFLISFRLWAQSPAEFNALFKMAHEKFETEIGRVDPSIRVETNPESCLRTGYNRKTRTIVFCPNEKIKNSGMDSVDVINHEFFHALLCNYDPQLCQRDDKNHVHEALADAFAYQLNPDRYFGENFYVAHPYIRKYQTYWRAGLVREEHERGNALAAEIIKNSLPLKTSLSLFQTIFPEEVKVEALARETSTLNRYRLAHGEVLQLKFAFASEAGVTSLKWITPPGVKATVNGLQTAISLNQDFREGKSIVLFLSAEGKELGRRTFYLGREL